MTGTVVRVYNDIGLVLLILISLIALRLLSYWRSFFIYWRRYRQREHVTTAHLQALEVPNIKLQITTRGSSGSTEVIMRGIRNIQTLADEDPNFYRQVLSIEVVTESEIQGHFLEFAFADCALPLEILVVPTEYETPLGTRFKARALHFAVERRRVGWNAKPGRTFIVHYDEESVMKPAELRKLAAVLAGTDKSILEGPIYYPLEYMQAGVIPRAMEANRPIGCFECRHVMESGIPLHLHGSNLVVEEELETRLGWDIGLIDRQPFLAEDYVFGMNAYLAAGKEAFGWHGCVMLEQPPFSFRSAFKQRHRWIFGVLQGMSAIRNRPEFELLSPAARLQLMWGTRFRIATFALGSVVGVLSLAYLPLLLTRVVRSLISGTSLGLSGAAAIWLSIVGLLWLGSVLVGAWYNVHEAGLSRLQRTTEIARAVAVAPVAGMLEGSAGMWAVIEWCIGRREVNWQPTPKTKEADLSVQWKDSSLI